MKGIIRHTLKKVTLELVYQVVDERTAEIKTELKELRGEVKDDVKRLDGKIDQLNQRIDTVIQMFRTIQQGQK